LSSTSTSKRSCSRTSSEPARSSTTGTDVATAERAFPLVPWLDTSGYVTTPRTSPVFAGAVDRPFSNSGPRGRAEQKRCPAISPRSR
jgi:hypothetical protein